MGLDSEIETKALVDKGKRSDHCLAPVTRRLCSTLPVRLSSALLGGGWSAADRQSFLSGCISVPAFDVDKITESGKVQWSEGWGGWWRLVGISCSGFSAQLRQNFGVALGLFWATSTYGK